MKVKKENNEKKVLGIKEVRVNVIRLTKEKIDSMINQLAAKDTMNYNFSLKFNKNEWVCTSHPKSIVPVISKRKNIFISLRKSNAFVSNVDISSAASVPDPVYLPAKAGYGLRSRPQKLAKNIPLINPKPVSTTTISELGVNVKKKTHWDACKKKVNKSALIEGAFVFAKQIGYAPWPSKIITINKSQTSAVVGYYGYANYNGTVKMTEIVQVDDRSMDEIGALISFTLKTKAIKEFERFEKAISEVFAAMQF